MPKTRRPGHRAKDRGGAIWTDTEGLKRILGVMGDLEHAELLLGARLMPLLDFSWPDLIQLANTLQSYAFGRELVTLDERLERLEKRSTRRAGRAA